MKLIDTHLHLDLLIQSSYSNSVNQEQQKIDHLFQEASDNDVTCYITVGTNRHDSVRGIAYALCHSSLFTSIGIHPLEWSQQWKSDIALLEQLLKNTKPGTIVAIGECGIDLYRSSQTVLEQKNLFCAQIELALEYKLPLIIHSRNAPEETYSCLDMYKKESLKGSIHCFSYNSVYAKEAYERGFVLGIGGSLTYPKNSFLREIVKMVPLHALILETDAPFLPPQPWRGQINHPRYIRHIAEQIAELRSISLEAVAIATTETACMVFGL